GNPLRSGRSSRLHSIHGREGSGRRGRRIGPFTGSSQVVDGWVTLAPGKSGNVASVMEAALTEVLRAGPLVVKPSQHVAVAGSTTLRLTRHELGLLIALARQPGAVVSRGQLAETAWGRPLGDNDRSVDVYVRRLRRKLADAAPGW